MNHQKQRQADLLQWGRHGYDKFDKLTIQNDTLISTLGEQENVSAMQVQQEGSDVLDKLYENLWVGLQEKIGAFANFNIVFENLEVDVLKLLEYSQKKQEAEKLLQPPPNTLATSKKSQQSQNANISQNKNFQTINNYSPRNLLNSSTSQNTERRSPLKQRIAQIMRSRYTSPTERSQRSPLKTQDSMNHKTQKIIRFPKIDIKNRAKDLYDKQERMLQFSKYMSPQQQNSQEQMESQVVVQKQEQNLEQIPEQHSSSILHEPSKNQSTLPLDQSKSYYFSSQNCRTQAYNSLQSLLQHSLRIENTQERVKRVAAAALLNRKH